MIKKLTFLFWNCNKKNVASSLQNIVKKEGVDIIGLAESAINETAKFINQLNKVTKKHFFYSPNTECTKIQLYSIFPADQLKFAGDNLRITTRSLKVSDDIELLFGVLHFLSKQFGNDRLQTSEALRLRHWFSLIEEKFPNYTLLFGDFNMQPFDEGMITYAGFNAAMTKKIALKKSRIVQGVKYPYLYNPM